MLRWVTRQPEKQVLGSVDICAYAGGGAEMLEDWKTSSPMSSGAMWVSGGSKGREVSPKFSTGWGCVTTAPRGSSAGRVAEGQESSAIVESRLSPIVIREAEEERESMVHVKNMEEPRETIATRES